MYAKQILRLQALKFTFTLRMNHKENELIATIFIYVEIYNRELLLTNTGRAIISSNLSSDLLNLKASKLCQLYFFAA